jgi:hypothetical protein
MLLGLPYGVNDAHYDLTMDNVPENPGFMQQRFTLQSAILAGKLIDRNVTPGTQSFANAVTLDEQMDNIASSMPAQFWDLPNPLPGPGLELDNIRHRMLQQLFFFHVRTYIYLPFIFKRPAVSTIVHSRLACMEASRQLLRRYVILRTNNEGVCLFECKTSDFVGFMGAVLLLLCHLSSRDLPSRRIPEEDLQLIELTRDFFETVASEEGCAISRQGHRALTLLLGKQDNTNSVTSHSLQSEKIPIPYFGVVLRKYMPRSPSGRTSDLQNNDSNVSFSAPVVTFVDDMATTNAPFTMGADNTQNSTIGGLQWDANGFFDIDVSDSFPWLDTIDIDGDWNYFFDSTEQYPDT